MTSRALIVPTTPVQANPLPYGELRIRKGAWDQLQARKAYRETQVDAEPRLKCNVTLDVAI